MKQGHAKMIEFAERRTCDAPATCFRFSPSAISFIHIRNVIAKSA
jgi:hypothetical protein